MPNPTRYTRGYSFSGWQANNPTLPLPGPSVDGELDNVSGSVNGAIGALADVRRADGALKDGIVTPESLDPDFYAALTNGLLPPTPATLRLLDAVALSALFARDLQHMKRRVGFTPAGGTAAGNSFQGHAIDERAGHIYTLQETGSTGLINRFNWSLVDLVSPFGQSTLTPLDHQPASAVVGHQALSLEYMTSGVKLWARARDPDNTTDVIRFDYTPAGAPANVERIALWPSGYTSSTMALSYAEPGQKPRYLVCAANQGDGTGVIRVWDFDTVIAAGGDASADYLYEMPQPDEAGINFYMQGIAATDTHVWTWHSSVNLYEPKIVRRFPITGPVSDWQSICDLGRNQASIDDPGNENWEGEGICLFRAFPGAPLSVAVSIVTGPLVYGEPKVNGLWVLGPGEPAIRRADGTNVTAFYGPVRFNAYEPVTLNGVNAFLQVQGQGQSRSSQSWVNWSSSGASEVNLAFAASRGGAAGVYGALADGDNVLQISYLGDNGTAFTRGGYDLVQVDGAPADGFIPLRLDSYTRDAAGDIRGWSRRANGRLHPSTDAEQDVGAASLRVREFFGEQGAINTSDATEKTAIAAPSNELLDAIGAVDVLTWRWADGVRTHAGPTAQDVRDALVAKSIDPATIAAYCADARMTQTMTDSVQEDGAISTTVGETPLLDGGEPVMRLGLRPVEIQYLMIAHLRRELAALAARVTALEPP